MGALVKNMRKVFAAFLCACLLISYNPAFGAVDAAFADETAGQESVQPLAGSMNDGGSHLDGNGASQEEIDKIVEEAKDYQWDADKGGTAETIVTVSTFDNTLATACRDSFSATVEQLRAGQIGDTDISYVWFEVTGGMPDMAAGADPYAASWQVFKNGALDQGLTSWITSASNDAIARKYEENVANYRVSLKKLADAYLLADGQKYTFTGQFRDTEGNGATLRVSVYTIQNGVVDFEPTLIKGKDELEGVELEGLIQDGTDLTGGKAPDASAAKDGMENAAAKDTVEGDDGGNYVIGDVLQIGTSPVKLPGTGGLDIPPYNSDDLTLRLPIDPDYEKSDSNPNGYAPGDKITVMWSGDDSGKVVPVEATIVRGDDGQLVAEIVYPYAGDEDGDGVDDTGWPPLPGYFGIEYDTNRLPDADQEEARAEYFSITDDVKGAGGTVTPTEKRDWRVKKGADATSVLEQATYAIAPASAGEKSYELSHLTLRQAGGSVYNFIDSAADASKAGRLSALKTTLTLTNSPEVFTANSAWVLSAQFFESSMTPEEAKGSHQLTVKAKKRDGSDASDWGGFYVYYYDANGEFMVLPEEGDAVGSFSEMMLNSAQATIVMVPASPRDGVYYQVEGVQMSVDGGEFEPQRLTEPFVVPPTTKNVEVNVIFGETTTGGLPTETFTAEASVKTPDLGTLVGEPTATYGATGPGPSFRFTGLTDDQYLDYVNVFVGDRETPERLNVNAGKSPDFTLHLPNYHANLRVEAYFNDAKSPSIELSVTVNTKYANGTVETSTAGGQMVPLNWELTGQVRSGQKCTMLLSANDGFELSALTEKRGDGDAVDRMAQVAGSVWAFQPIDDREDTSDPLRIAVTITFSQVKNGGTGGEGDNGGKPSRVSVYVADAGLASADDAELAYAFKPEAGKFESNAEADRNDAAAAVSPANYKSTFGQVNGQPSLFHSVDYNGDLPLNLVGNTLEAADGATTRYGIEKVLVVTYYYATDPATGVQVKKPLKWRLFHTNVPLYVMENVTTHTDVFAYFAPIGDGTGGTTGDGGFTEDDFVDVTVSSTPAGLVSPSGAVPVLKGGMLPIDFTMRTADKLLKSATVKRGSAAAVEVTDELSAAAAGASRAAYTLKNIAEDTVVKATYKDRPAEEVQRHALSANMQVRVGDSVEPVGSGAKPCGIAVGSGENYAQLNHLANGAGNGIEFAEGSNLKVTLTRDEGYYQLDDLSFTWSDPNVFAYRDTVLQADGSVRHVIGFAADQGALTGKQPYEAGSALYGDEADAPDATQEVWFIENLLAPVTVVPVYEKIERPDVPTSTDSWTVTTKVGRGFGSVVTDWPTFSGSVTKVPKKGGVSSSSPLTVTFAPAEGYRVADVRVETSTGNLLDDFWALVTGFLEHLGDPDAEKKMKEEALANGYIKLTSVKSDYEIVVDFEPIPGAISPDDPLGNQVAVNVVYDPTRGTVTPNAGLTVDRGGKQQFSAAPKKVGDKFYSVAGVKVSVGDGEPVEVRAIDKSSPLVQWGDPFYNTFVVDFSQLNWPAGQTDAAATVEVLFSDEATTEGGEGGGSTAPGTPTDDDVKLVTVNVVADGEPVIGDGGLGGVVSPRGEFRLVPGSTDAYSQRVYVRPSDDYELDTIRVVRDGDADGGLGIAHGYILSVKNGNGFFEVKADAPGTEVITVYLKQKPLSERSYTIEVRANVADADRFITPHGALTLGNDREQTYSIDPDPGFQVASIRDVGLDENGDEVVLPADENGARGANWSRGDSTEAKSSFTVAPVRVDGKVVDRSVVVTFEKKSGIDHGVADADKVDVRVMAIGAGSEFLTFSPAEDLTGVVKGSADSPVSYNYRFELSDAAIDAGYAVYWVQNNGKDWFGSAQNASDLKTAGEFAFTTENMDRDVNTLLVYVKHFEATGEPDDPSALVTVEYGCGDGGSIEDKTPGSQRADGSSASAGGLTGNVMTTTAGEPFTLLMTPDQGSVLSEVYLHNCYVLDYNWVAPDDGRTAKVALAYTMMVTDEQRPARVFALFAKGDANTFRPWDHTHVDDRDSYTTDGTFVVEVAPAEGVEALVEVNGETVKAGDMLQVHNPVAPFSPQVSATAAEGESAAGYAATFDTISKVSDPDNVRIVVGPLIKWDDYENHKSTLYTIDGVSGLEDGFTVIEKPIAGTGQASGSDGRKPAGAVDAVGGSNELEGDGEVGDGSDGSDGDGAVIAVPQFYTYYEISGALAADEQRAEGEPRVVHIDLRKLGLSDGEFPEYADRVPAGMVKLQAQVVGGKGTIAPTSTGAVGTSWFDGNVAGPWIVAEGSAVAFKVEADEGYVLSALTYDGTDALGNGSFNADDSTLTFVANTSTTVYAEFVTEDSPEALRTVTIEVDGAHGTTSPAPGDYQVEKGKPYPISFNADAGYVPYRIWVDDVESYVAPTLSGWMLPASWHDQKFKVQFALAGTTPSSGDYLNQAGQNLLNKAGTALVKTGDNPWLPLIVLLLVGAGLAAFGAMRLMRASEAAGRAAKYSVTRREDAREKAPEEAPEEKDGE